MPMGGSYRHCEFQGTETVRPYGSPRQVQDMRRRPPQHCCSGRLRWTTMSAATFCSLLNISDSCWALTWPTIWLLWRRIARNILRWLMAGSRMNKTMRNNRRMYRTVPGRIKWSTIVTKNQAAAVMNAAFFASVEKSKMYYSSTSSVSSSNMTESWTTKMNMVWKT